MQDLTAAILERAGITAWSGHRVVTLERFLEHYAVHLDATRALTPLQLRQIVAACILEAHRDSGETRFPGHVVGDRVSHATLSALTRLVTEIEPYGWTPEALEQALGVDPSARVAPTAITAQAHRVAEVYRRVRERLHAGSYVGPRVRLLRATDLATTLAPPFEARRFLFLGFDGKGPWDPGIRLLSALCSHQDVERVILALVMDPIGTVSGWSAHGNDALYNRWLDLSGCRRIGASEAACVTATRDVPHDIAALASSPFAFGAPERLRASAVRAFLMPDPAVEVEWVASDIKRQLLERADLGPGDVAVVARSMEELSGDVARACERVGLPVYASVPVRLCDVPAVRAILALFRLPAHGWHVRDLRFVADSSYLDTGLDSTLIAQLALGAEPPASREAWTSRIREQADATRRRLANLGEAVDPHEASWVRIEEAFTTLCAQLDFVGASAERLSPSEWVTSFVNATACWLSAERIATPSPHVPHLRHAELARTDFDGVNRLTQAADDWLLGRQIAGLTDEPMEAAAWYDELAAMTEIETVRASTYARDAVQIIDPEQAALRQWRLVYVIGLTDGTFPLHSQRDEQSLSDAERRAIQLPTREERAARERLLFQLAVAAARDRLTLTAPATDIRGKALVQSPFLAGLGLRLDGIQIRSMAATDLVPANEAAVLARTDIDLLAANRYRDTVEPALGVTLGPGLLAGAEVTRLDEVRSAIARDPLLSAWLADHAAERVLDAWTVEYTRDAVLRADLGASPQTIHHEFAGCLPADALPAALADPESAFSPSDFALYERCHFRFFATRALGIRDRDEREEDHDEAAAFGILQHAILEELHRALERDGQWPPRGESDIQAALGRLPAIAKRAVTRYAASAHAEFYPMDMAFVTDLLRQFVRRDLAGLTAAVTDMLSPRVRTRLVDLEVALGDNAAPLAFEVDGVRFRLKGTIDRIEAVDDPRFPKAQGWLVLRDYKSGGPRWSVKAETWLRQHLEGQHLQLPLYAAMAARHYGRRVFGFGELWTYRDSDAPFIAAAAVVPDGEGVKLAPAHDEIRNPVEAITKAALTRAAQIVRGIRAGEFAPQAGRSCWGCHLRQVCRAATYQDPAGGRMRARMPLAVTLDEFRSAQTAAQAAAAAARTTIARATTTST